ncbi:MAG: FAD/NAD(P)-binding protein [Desulfobulbaceae bacterium]|nr:FAD/NAD(P)-binding protein [Desulfobulbaceae bacterium]
MIHNPQKPWPDQPLRGGGDNVYLPQPAVIKEIIVENELVKTFVFDFEDVLAAYDFRYQPGQFMMISAPHCGEAPISFSSSPSRPGSFELTIRKTGKLTNAFHQLQAGDVIGVRGPYGKPFPMEELKGKDLLFVAGGIGLAPLRSAIIYALDHRNDYGTIQVLYGSKQPDEQCFNVDLQEWQDQGVDCLVTVDKGDENWSGRVGLVTKLLEEINLTSNKLTALVCGPGIMIRFVLERLQEMGLSDDQMITTLERHMKCGVGICNHCYLDGRLVCVDGPVFYKSELTELERL